MNLLAIASIWNGRITVGARVLDIDSKKIADYTNEQLIQGIKNGGSIKNLEVKDGQISWVQGGSDRYPKINANNLNEVENTNSIVIIARYKNEADEKTFIVTNYMGNIAHISERRLVKYGIEHTLANCKVVTKGNTSYISAISGEIDTIDNKIEFRYDKYKGVLIIKLPPMGASKIVIPSMIRGSVVSNVKQILVVPTKLKAGITHLVLPNTLDDIGRHLLINFPNIRKLECEANLRSLTRATLGLDNKELRSIRFKTIGTNNSGVFEGLTKLEELEIQKKPAVIGRKAFVECTKLSVDQMLYEGVTEIASGAFKGCEQLKKVKIPKTVKKLNVAAFEGCRNIEVVIISSPETEIRIDFYAKDYKLLDDSPNAVLYIPKYFPRRNLRAVAEHVKIVEYDSGINEEEIKQSQLKAKVLGLSIRESDIAKTPQESLGALSLMGEEQWRKSVIECAVDAITNQGNRGYVIGDMGSYLRVYLGLLPYRGLTIKQSKVGKNYLYVVYGRAGVRVLLINKIRILEILKDAISTGDYSKIPNRYGIYEAGNEYTLNVPMVDLDISASLISKIYEDEDDLVIKLRNRTERRVRI